MKKGIPLRIIKKLPQIIIPDNKVEYFIDWYNKDLRFLDNIPHSFEKGYMFFNGRKFFGENNNKNFGKKIISNMAKMYKTTYRNIEKLFFEFLKEFENAIVYFEFDKQFLNIELYVSNNLVSTLKLDYKTVDKEKPNPTLEEKMNDFLENPTEDVESIYVYYSFVLLQAALWYIATATNNKKYYREEKIKPFVYEEKTVISVKKNKTINTPIYNFNNVKRIKVEGLIKRRKGWTYSHSFEVHGHYRHYSNGKVIFINPFIKGKGKPQINQKITLNPKEEKYE